MSKLTAYDLKAKKKNVPFEGAPALNRYKKKTGKYSYMAKGQNKAGNTMCLLMGEENALKALKAGDAVKGEGW